LRTYCNAAAWTSSSVAGGSKLWSVLMFLHTCESLRSSRHVHAGQAQSPAGDRQRYRRLARHDGAKGRQAAAPTSNVRGNLSTPQSAIAGNVARGRESLPSREGEEPEDHAPDRQPPEGERPRRERVPRGADPDEH
jgi:hypothetical protein